MRNYIVSFGLLCVLLFAYTALVLHARSSPDRVSATAPIEPRQPADAAPLTHDI